MSTKIRLLYGSERYGWYTGGRAHHQIIRDALLKGIPEAAAPPAAGVTRTKHIVGLYKLLLNQRATNGKKLMVWRVPRSVRNCEYRAHLKKFMPKLQAAPKAVREGKKKIGLYGGVEPHPAVVGWEQVAQAVKRPPAARPRNG
jgi:chitinase